MKGIVARIRKKIRSFRFEPIRVFVFHQVSDVFDASTMWKCDWTDLDVFQKNIYILRKQYDFISLKDAQLHLNRDIFRRRKYAVLTSDDGWASLKQVIPWLAEERIPITLFLNPKYLDGLNYQERSTEKLLTKDEVYRLVEGYNPFITIASHGWSHRDASEMSLEEFESFVKDSEKVLQYYPHKIDFFAFPYGRATSDELCILRSMGIIPVMVDGEKNFSDASVIHRECIDGTVMK